MSPAHGRSRAPDIEALRQLASAAQRAGEPPGSSRPAEKTSWPFSLIVIPAPI